MERTQERLSKAFGEVLGMMRPADPARIVDHGGHLVGKFDSMARIVAGWGDLATWEQFRKKVSTNEVDRLAAEARYFAEMAARFAADAATFAALVTAIKESEAR